MMSGFKPDTTLSSSVLSVLRIITGLLFLAHGTSKFLNFPSTGKGMPSVMTMSGFGGLLELVGGAMIVLGLFTRPVAFLLCGEMAVAYFVAHAPRNFFPILNGGEGAILFCFVFLYLAVAGAGRWSIDAMRSRA